MFKRLIFTFFLLFSSFITIYPSKNENINLFDYCYAFEKIVSRNSVENSKNLSKKYKSFAKDITLFSANKTKGNLANKAINQYKISKKIFIINLVPNKFYCLAGYWIEQVNPGIFATLLYEKSQESINKYKNFKKELDQFFTDFNSEYNSIKEEINDLF